MAREALSCFQRSQLLPRLTVVSCCTDMSHDSSPRASFAGQYGIYELLVTPVEQRHLELQVAVAIGQIWHVWAAVMHAWHGSETMPDEVAQVLGIAMVDGLAAVGLLAGLQAVHTCQVAAVCVNRLLLGSTSTSFLIMLNPQPGTVRLLQAPFNMPAVIFFLFFSPGILVISVFHRENIQSLSAMLTCC